ncbi:MAG: hypothetical protein KA419_20215 [Acidobacteria bacterium]|nr:hypothetical protein [Acidobacteriota bacterium]
MQKRVFGLFTGLLLLAGTAFGAIGAVGGIAIGAAIPTGSETLYRTERP